MNANRKSDRRIPSEEPVVFGKTPLKMGDDSLYIHLTSGENIKSLKTPKRDLNRSLTIEPSKQWSVRSLPRRKSYVSEGLGRYSYKIKFHLSYIIKGQSLRNVQHDMKTGTQSFRSRETIS